MRVVTSNIKNVINGPLFRRRARQTAQLGNILLFQEIKGRHDHRNLQRAIGDEYEISHDDLPIPIAVLKSRYEILSRGKRKMHGGKRKTSPSRWVVWVIVRDLRTGDEFAVVNTHFVSGAWNRKPKRNKRWRKRMWRRHHRRMRKLILELIDLGYPVVGGGDFNRKRKVPKFLKRQRWIANAALDKLFFINYAEYEFCVQRTGKKDVTRIRDHKAWWAIIKLVRTR